MARNGRDGWRRCHSGAAVAVADLAARLAEGLAHRHQAAGRSLLIGINGAQGSGKSTLAAGIAAALSARGLRVAVLSLDDLYLSRAARAALARDVHPLLATRGVPGTHDVARGEAVISALLSGQGRVAVPRFDKARDDPGADAMVAAPVDLLLFEGWCIGATAQPASALAAPVNVLEAAEDRDGRWRRHVNVALAGEYARLFARIDALIALRAPDFDVVAGWRAQQEADLGRDRTMDAVGIARFVAHFERLTRHMLAGGMACGGRPADIVVDLDRERRMIGLAGAP